MFIAAFSTFAKIQRQPKCPVIDEGVTKLWYTFFMEYYSAVKKDKILPFVATLDTFGGYRAK